MKPQRISSLLLTAGLLAVIAFPGSLPAADLTGQEAANFVSKFKTQGKIDDVNVRKNHLVVDDSLEVLAADVRVYGRRGEKDYASSLKKGMKIGFNTTSDPEKGVQVSEIVILSYY